MDSQLRRQMKSRKQAQMLSMGDYYYAHRGYHHEPEAPENSLAAFRLAVLHGYGVELDVHLLSDGNLAVLHDSSLKRMTGHPGVVEDLKESSLPEYYLGNSRETIPSFRQVLDVIHGKIPMIVELKPYQGNAERLCTRVFEELDHYDGAYCVESFDPRVVRWLRKNRPEVIRGQLSMNFYKERSSLSFLQAVAGTELLTNILTKPDFVAYRFADRKHLSNRICLKTGKIQGVSWTLHSREELLQAKKEDCWPIFENFDPETGARFDGAEDT